MIDVIILLIIGSWFYKTAFERKQSKAVWVLAGMGGYLLGEIAIGWTLMGFVVEADPDLWFLQTVIIIASGLFGMLVARFVLLNLWKEGQGSTL
jgi:predicted membrane protein